MARDRIAFLGGGVMAEAMLRALLDRRVLPASHITVTGPRRERRGELAKAYGVTALAANAEAAKGADVVVLAVKPQVLPTVLKELRGKLRAEQLVVSIVAGATVRALETGLAHPAIVRAMPNTPAQVGMGVTAWYAPPAVSAAQRERTKQILSAFGEELMVEDESYLDMATALSGTGPTYVFLLMEALVDAGVHLGFSRRVAEELVLRTVEGCALRPEERPAPRRAAEHGHLAGRHERRGDLPAREGLAAHGALEGRVRGLPALERARRRRRAEGHEARVRDALAVVLAVAAGLLLVPYDLHTDDTGVEAGLLLLASLALGALAPRRWWLIGLAVGLPIPFAEFAGAPGRVPPGIVAVVVTIAGAGIGSLLARAARPRVAAGS